MMLTRLPWINVHDASTPAAEIFDVSMSVERKALIQIDGTFPQCRKSFPAHRLTVHDEMALSDLARKCSTLLLGVRDC